MQLTHLNAKGEARMVDVGAKDITARIARAEGYLIIPKPLIEHLNLVGNGSAYEIARLAGILGAKKTSELIPLCHGLNLDTCALEWELRPSQGQVRVIAETRCTGKTGVELEALVAVSMALLTLYAIVMESADAGEIKMGRIRLLYKSGGKSGSWVRNE